MKSPNPAFREVDVPLASTFMLSTKAGKEAWVEPVIETGRYRFAVKVGTPKNAEAAKNGTKLARGANFACVMSGMPIAGEYIKAEGKAGRMSTRLMAIVAEGERGRFYLSPTPEQEASAKEAEPEWKPDGAFVEDARAFTPFIYGLGEWKKLFTDRQMVALTTYTALIPEVIRNVRHDARTADIGESSKPLSENGTEASAYSEAIAMYLSLSVSKIADSGNALVSWKASMDQPIHLFTRNAVPMVWDFAEPNSFGNAMGDFGVTLRNIARVLDQLPASTAAYVRHADAQSQIISESKIVSTDPPYYDNVPYADLSDFFYVWLRRCMGATFPDIFATLAVPKAEELVATPYRHGGKTKAENFFLEGMTQAMRRLAEQSHPAFPVTIYYAFKQAESDDSSGTASTGWETFLDAVVRAGFSTTGTWPIRTELGNRIRGIGANALASSIVLVCRPRPMDAFTATRRDFVAALQRELPEALRHLQAGNIAPVDLAQAAIGPGMAVFTRYAKVIDANGKELKVREALTLINETLDIALAEQEGDFDGDTRWALAWFEQYGFAEGEYGVAETLSKAKNTSISGLADSGILVSARGKVRLLRPDELPTDWDPLNDARLTVWEMVHHLIRMLDTGETPAAELIGKLGVRAETARELAYRLYTVAERKKRAAEALAYNGLVQSWPDLLKLAQEQAANRPDGPLTPQQTEFL